MYIRVKMTRPDNASAHGVSIGGICNLDMEAYLRGVVPSEVYAGSDPVETLKAQSVAARTYATSFVNSNPGASFHVDDTTQFQSYMYSNIHSRTDSAIQATTGQILMYNGSCCTTMFSANNGGRTRSAYDYNGTHFDYLLERPDPWNGSGTVNGHRVGMSQTGARALGSSGKTYKEILGFYYPLTRLISNYGSGSYELIGSYMNQTGVTCQESGSVNIRNQANGSIIRTLGKDVTVTVLAEDPAAGFGWFRIRDPQGNTDGWIRWDFVEFGGNGGSEPPPSGGIVGKTGTVSVNSAGLNVRSSPNGSLLPYKLYNGHRITVLQEQAAGGYNWFRVNDEEGRTDGWVRSDFIVLDSGSGSGYSSWQEKYGDNTFVNSTTYSGNVYRFQVDLNKWLGSNGYSTITEDGKWGSNSSNATRTFQANNGLTADGLAGPSTKQKLFSLYGQ